MPHPITNFNKDDYTDTFVKDLYNENWQTYHFTHFRPKNMNFAKILLEMYNWESVVDFGCSIGSLLEVFMKAGKTIKGYEYCYEESLPSIKKIPGLENYIEFGDVSKDIDAGLHDASISIEVAEHIPTEYSESLVKNLVTSTKELVVFTAATPGQGGTGHINCQNPSFWINLFKKYNFEYDMDETANIRSKCIPTKDVYLNTFPHIWEHVYRNLMVFRKIK